MNTLAIKIADKTCVLFFGYACFRGLSEIWELPGYQGVLNKLAGFGTMESDLSFAQMEMIGDVIQAALTANPEKQPDVSRDDIMNQLMGNVMLIAEIVNKLVSVIQKPAEPQGNGKAAKQSKNQK